MWVWWEAPMALSVRLALGGAVQLQSSAVLGAAPHPLLSHWVPQCCNPSAGARPHPANSQIDVPVTGVETSCGHLGKSELYSLSTFLMAQPISAAVGKYGTWGPCVYFSQ